MAGAARLVRGALRGPRASDRLVSLVVAAIVATAVIGAVRTPDARRVDAVTVAILAAQVVPLLWRQRWPIGALAIAWSSVLAYLLLGHPPFTTLFAGPIAATYAATAYGAPRLRVVAAFTSIVGVSLAFVIANVLGPEPNVPEALITGLVFAVAWIGGDLARTRRAHVRALEERAERLEREREQEARAAVAAERNRIARELHDVVAHHVSVMVIQASAARRVPQGEHGRRADALASIESAGRQALTELRTLLEAFRGGEGDAALEPQPTLERLDDLVERTRASGLDVELIVDGVHRALPSGVELSAYRIVQEALTNALRYSGAKSVRVRLIIDPHEVVVDVTDDGMGGDPRETDGGGQGLVGMRERVSLFGGTFHAGPLLGGGWRVRASLPLDRQGT